MRTPSYSHSVLKRENIFERLRVAMDQDEIGAPLATEEVVDNLTKSMPLGCWYDAARGRISGDGVGGLKFKDVLDFLDTEVFRVQGDARSYSDRFEPLGISKERFDEIESAFAIEPELKLEIDPAGDSQPVPILVVNESLEIAGFSFEVNDTEFADLMDPGILRQHKKQLESWLVSRIHTDPGTYHEPPMTDIVELRTFPTLVEAICFAQSEYLKEGVRNKMESDAMARWAEEDRS